MNSNSKLVSLLHDIISDRLTNFGFETKNAIIFDTSLTCGHGYLSTSNTFESLHDVYDIHIGIKDINVEKIDVHQLTLLFKNTFHELQHVKQEFLHKTDDSYEMYSMGLVYISCLLYDAYYKDKYNYFHNIKEIDAEYVGLKNTYDLLCELYGSEIAINQILEFVNHRVNRYKIHGMSYYIDTNCYYHNVSDVYAEFEKSKMNSMFCKRHCDFWNNNDLFANVCSEINGQRQDELLVRKFFHDNPIDAKQIKKNTIALKYL